MKVSTVGCGWAWNILRGSERMYRACVSSDAASANDPQHEALLENADLIYFSGGNPQYLFETMHGSRAWVAMQKAWNSGAVYAGCSAGAMILSERIPSFRLAGTGAGFGIFPAKFIIPHFDAIPGLWKTAGVCAEEVRLRRSAHARSG